MKTQRTLTNETLADGILGAVVDFFSIAKRYSVVIYTMTILGVVFAAVITL